METINNLERKLRDDDELKRKDKIILDLEAQIEAAKSTYNFQPRVDEISMNFLKIFVVCYPNHIDNRKVL